MQPTGHGRGSWCCMRNVDHGIPIELLDQMYLGVSPSGTKTWKLPPVRWLIDVWEKSDFRL